MRKSMAGKFSIIVKQVFIMISKEKKYYGCFSSEKKAATYYDRLAIQNHGKNVSLSL